MTSPSIGLSHSDDGYGYMSKPRNQNRTFHLLQKADILTCYEQPQIHEAFRALSLGPETMAETMVTWHLIS